MGNCVATHSHLICAILLDPQVFMIYPDHMANYRASHANVLYVVQHDNEHSGKFYGLYAIVLPQHNTETKEKHLISC